MITKMCRRCGQTLDIEAFPDRSLRCQPCLSEYASAVRRQRTLQGDQAPRVRSWMESCIQVTRRQAAARGLDHELVAEDLAEIWEYQGERCFWLNVAVVRPTLLELKEGRGFVAGNVVLVAKQLAAQRHGRTPDEMGDLVHRLGSRACTYFGVRSVQVSMRSVLEQAVPSSVGARSRVAKPVRKTRLQEIDDILAIERSLIAQPA